MSTALDYALKSLEERSRHSVESISETMASLRTLAETLPDITQMADGAPYTRNALTNAVKMLASFRLHVSNKTHADETRRLEAQHHDLMATLEKARGEGIALGIEQEKNRANEARKGRTKKAAPAKGAK